MRRFHLKITYLRDYVIRNGGVGGISKAPIEFACEIKEAKGP